MYICICNALTEKQIDTACKSGAQSWPEIYSFYDCEPQCGKCIPEVCQRLNGSDEVSPVFFGIPALAEV